MAYDVSTFQGLIFAVQDYWQKQGCAVLQPLDMEVGAGTFHPATFLRAIGPEPWRSAYVQPCRRPTDGRYGENPNRLQHYYQFQVVMKPSPDNIQDLYLDSLRALGIDTLIHDVRFVDSGHLLPAKLCRVIESVFRDSCGLPFCDDLETFNDSTNILERQASIQVLALQVTQP